MALDRLAQLAVDIVINARRAASQLNTFRGNVDKNTQALRRLRGSITNIGLAASAFLILRRVISLITDTIKASVREFVKLEKQILSIEKIAKSGNIDKVQASFFGLSKGTLGTEFKDISETMITSARAGVRLGEGLEDVTRAALRLQQASLDISAKDAAEGLSALSINLTGSVDNVSNLASGVDALSDNFITTSGEILKTSARLSGFAAAVGLSAEELTGLSAALLSTRTSPTVVRSSISKLLISLQADTEKVARVLDLTKAEFEDFQVKIRDKPVEAIKQFIKALVQLNPKDQIDGLKKLGLASSRVQAVIKILPEILGNIDNALEISNAETAKGTSLLDKYAISVNSAGTNLIELQKAWSIFIAGLLNNKKLLRDIGDLLKSLGGDVGFEAGPKLGETLPELDSDILDSYKKLLDLIEERKEILSGGVRFSFPGFGKGSAQRGVENRREIEDLELFLQLSREKRQLLRKAKITEGKTQGEVKLFDLKTDQFVLASKIDDLDAETIKKKREQIKLETELADMLANPGLNPGNNKRLQRITEINERLPELEKERVAIAKELERALSKHATSLIAIAKQTKEITNIEAERVANKKRIDALDKEVKDRLKASLGQTIIELTADKLTSSLLALDKQAKELGDKFRFANEAGRDRLAAIFMEKKEALILADVNKKIADAAKAREKEASKLSQFTGALGDPLSLALKFNDILKNVDDPELQKHLENLFDKEFFDKGMKKKDTKPAFIGATELWKKAITETKKDDTAIAKEHLEIAKRVVDLAVEDSRTALMIKEKLDEIAAKTGKGFEVGP